MDDLQSWWEVPSIAHFCSLFRAAFNLLDFDIEELENALLTDGLEDCGSCLLQDLIVKLLTGCLSNNSISTANYQMFLRRLFRQKCSEYGKENPFDNDMDFQFLSLRTKVEILHALCDFRLDAEDVMDLLKNLDSDSLRVHPLGRDRSKSVYWYFYGTRLYREDHNKKKEEEKKSEKRGRGRKKGKNNKSDKNEPNEIGTGEWNVVCFSESDWERLVLKTEDSGDKEEEALHQILAKDFLPEIPRLFEEKERLQRKRLLEMQPRRQSSRIEKLKHQKEEEEKMEMERRKEEVERRKRMKEMAIREYSERSEDVGEVQRREQIKKDRERRKQEREMRKHRQRRSSESSFDWRSSSDQESEKDYERVKIADDKAKPKGRQTNNSLSSATGQIIIQSEPVKQKPHKHVFPTSFEDVKIGMYKILEKLKNLEDAWPFLFPVESEDAPRYYKVIKEPMDLQTMEDKLDGREYLSATQFKRDFKLIVDNCKKFNGPSSEYSGMVVSLEKEFNLLVSKYLAELSSDEDVAPEVPEENRKHKHKKEKHHKSSSSIKKKYHHDEYLDDKENEERSSTPAESSFVTKSVCSSLDEKIEDSQDDELEETRSSDSRTRRKGQSKKSSSSSQKKPPPPIVKSSIKSAAAIEALELATEQTLKDINKWLDDTPKFSEYSCDNISPARDHLGVVDDLEVQNRIESEYRRSFPLEKPPRAQKESLKRRPPKDPQNALKKKREIQRKIDRLQPGKSKGNLLTTNKQPSDETTVSGSNSKESAKADESDLNAPKLSLGTVLLSDDIALGSLGSKKPFPESPLSDSKYSDDEKFEISDQVKEVKLDLSDSESKLSERFDSKPTESTKSEVKKEEEDADEKSVVKAATSVPEKSVTKAETSSTKEKPNLSAWFKAFGAPKATPAPKRKTDFGNPPTPSPLVDFRDSSNDIQSYKYRYLDDKPLDSPNDLPPMTPGRSLSPDDRDRKITYNSPDVRPGTRKRKASTGSSVSERSSFSQDPTDPTLSPHPSLDEPYLSPQQDVAKSFHHSPVNGTIKVGFYQDTFPRGGSDKSNSCSPREPPSNSPRNLSLSPKHSQLDSPDYHKNSAPSTPAYQAPPSPTPTYNSSVPFYPSHSSSLMQNVPYYDVNKSVAEQYSANLSAAEQFSANKSITEQYTSNKSITEQYISNKSITEQYTSNKSITEQYTSNKSVSEPYISNKSVAEQFISNKSVADQYISNKSVADQYVSNKSVADQYTSNKPVPEQYISNKSVPEQYISTKSVVDQYSASIPATISKPSPIPPTTTVVMTTEKPASSYPVKKRAYCEVETEPQPQLQSVIKPVVEKSSGFTPISSSRDPERVFTPAPGRMPQSTERAIGLHHRYPNELLQTSPYYSNDNMFSKSTVPTSSVPSVSSYPPSDGVATSSGYSRTAGITDSSSSYPSYNRLSAPPYNYANPMDRSLSSRAEKQVALNYSSSSNTSSDALSSKSMPPINYSSVPTSSSNVSSKPGAPLNYLDRGNPELLNFSKLHPSHPSHAAGSSHPPVSNSSPSPDLSSRLVENPSRSNPHMSYPTNRAVAYSKVEIPPQPPRVHYTNPISDLSSKMNIPSGLGYNQSAPLSYPHPMGDLHYNYPGMMPEMIPGKSSVNYPGHPHPSVNYNVDAYKHPMVVAANKAPAESPQPAAKAAPKVVVPKKSRKKKAIAEAEASHADPISSSSYQQYASQSSSEPISLKTTSVVPGSAFNFGPAPLKDSYSSYLEDMSRSSYYLPHSGSGLPDAGSSEEKSSSTPHTAPSYPFLSGTPRPPYPHLTHPSPALYQQYLQRHQQDLLRPMVIHQGLLGPPSSYPPGYIMHDPLNRPPHWM